jgi:hypothetical protein
VKGLGWVAAVLVVVATLMPSEWGEADDAVFALGAVLLCVDLACRSPRFIPEQHADDDQEDRR